MVIIKESKDRQEEDLKHFYMPDNNDFGIDRQNDYSFYYECLYETLVNGAEQLVKPEQTIKVMEILEQGIAEMHNN